MKTPLSRFINNFLPYVIALGVWLLIAFFHLVSSHLDALKFNPEKQLLVIDFISYGLSYSAWAILCGLTYNACDRFYETGVFRLSLVIFMALVVIWLPIYLYYDAYIYALLHQQPILDITTVLRSYSLAIYFFYTILSVLSLVACLAIIANKRNQAAILAHASMVQQQAKHALVISQQQLQILQSQLSPHFLFNCLSAISALVRKDNKEQLLTSITKVAGLLRYANQASQSQTVALEDELSFVSDYIELQKLRFGERFHFRLHESIQSRQLQIMPFIFQPLIENAFHHAVSNTDETVVIELTIELSQVGSTYNLFFELTNTHAGTDNHGWGSGISNLKRRLQLIYGQNCQFNTEHAGDRYRAQLSLTFKEPHDTD